MADKLANVVADVSTYFMANKYADSGSNEHESGALPDSHLSAACTYAARWWWWTAAKSTPDSSLKYQANARWMM